MEVTFTSKLRSKAVVMTVDGAKVLFRDDGEKGDIKAGDGAFTGVVRADFEAEAKAFDAKVSSLKKIKEPMPIFAGRAKVGTINLSRLQLVRTKASLPLTPTLCNLNIDPRRSLFITDLSVVENPQRTWNHCSGIGDPDGVWTFKHLMTEMCNQPLTGIDPSDFVEKWIASYGSPMAVENGLTTTARPNVITQVLNNWPRINGKLDLKRSPFKLLAIVNRIDLRDNAFYGGGNAGEARFVFGSINSNCNGTRPFLVIFEYGVPKSGCAVRDWGKQWVKLSQFPIGSANYLQALEDITLQFTERNAAPSKPNGSALNQLRSNEFLNSPWQLREWSVDANDQVLRPRAVALTAGNSFRFGADAITLANYLISQAPPPAVAAIPLFLGTQPFRGARADTPFPSFFWNPPVGVANLERRHVYSLNTCNACHAGETQTLGGPTGAFRHVREKFYGTEATLSFFLTGDPGNPADNFWHDVNDPAGQIDPGTGQVKERLFNEFERRRIDLETLVCNPCLSQIFHKKAALTH